MRYSDFDWAVGWVAIAVAILPYSAAIHSVRLVGLQPGMSRAEVEESLGGSGEPSPRSYFYTICLGPTGNRTREDMDPQQEAMHTEERWYPRPMHRSEVVYGGLRDQRLTSVTFVPLEYLEVAGWLLAIPLVLMAAETSRFLCRRFVKDTTSATA